MFEMNWTLVELLPLIGGGFKFLAVIIIGGKDKRSFILDGTGGLVFMYYYITEAKSPGFIVVCLASIAIDIINYIRWSLKPWK